MRKLLLALAVLALFVGNADAQSPTPAVVGSPVIIDPPGFRVLSRGKCLVDPSASLGDGAEVIVSCAASGAQIGSLVLASIEPTSDVSDTYIKRASVTENGRVDFSIGSYTAAQNPGSFTILFAIVQ